MIKTWFTTWGAEGLYNTLGQSCLNKVSKADKQESGGTDDAFIRGDRWIIQSNEWKLAKNERLCHGGASLTGASQRHESRGSSFLKQWGVLHYSPSQGSAPWNEESPSLSGGHGKVVSSSGPTKSAICCRITRRRIWNWTPTGRLFFLFTCCI